MLRKSGRFNRQYLLGAYLVLALGSCIALAPSGYADDVAPSGGESEAGSAAGSSAAGSGTSTAAAEVSQESTTTMDPETVSASAETGGSATGAQQSEGQSTTAGVETSASAGAENNGNTLSAEAKADSSAGAVAVTVTDQADTGSQSSAAAAAQSGAAPTARASAGSDVYAFAVGGDDLTTVARAGDNDTIETTQGENETTTIAYTASGMYSVAVANSESAGAFASTFGNGGALTAEQVYTAVRTAAAAFAAAGRTDASAWATSSGWSFGGTPYGVSAAASASWASASITVSVAGVGSGSSSDDGASAPSPCTKEDWKRWRIWKASTDPNKGRFVCAASQNLVRVTWTAGPAVATADRTDAKVRVASSASSPAKKPHRTPAAASPSRASASTTVRLAGVESGSSASSSCTKEDWARWRLWKASTDPNKGRFVCAANQNSVRPARTMVAAVATADRTNAKVRVASSASSPAKKPHRTPAAASPSRAKASTTVRLAAVESGSFTSSSCTKEDWKRWRIWKASTDPNKGRYACAANQNSVRPAQTAVAAVATAARTNAKVRVASSASSPAKKPHRTPAAASASKTSAFTTVKLAGVERGSSTPSSCSKEDWKRWRIWKASTDPNRGRFVCGAGQNSVRLASARR